VCLSVFCVCVQVGLYACVYVYTSCVNVRGLGCVYICLQVLMHNVYTHEAAAAAKSLQSCPTLCDPIDGRPLAPPSLVTTGFPSGSAVKNPPVMHKT